MRLSSFFIIIHNDRIVNYHLIFFFELVSVTGKRGVGIPLILLHDAEGGIVTVELKNGCIYRGLLDEAQDNMNCTLKVCKLTIF